MENCPRAPVALGQGALSLIPEPALRARERRLGRQSSESGLATGYGYVFDLARGRLYVSPRSLARCPLRACVSRRSLLARVVLQCLCRLALRCPERLAGGQAPLLLHASAVAGPRGALVFCGYSGFGKSTIAGMLLSGCRGLEDDLTTLLLDVSGAGPSARPRVIWAEQCARGAPPEQWLIPVAGLFWLEKGQEFALHQMSTAEALAGLLGPLPPGLTGAEIHQRLHWLRGLLQAAPCRRLTFRKDAGALCAFLRQQGLL